MDSSGTVHTTTNNDTNNTNNNANNNSCHICLSHFTTVYQNKTNFVQACLALEEVCTLMFLHIMRICIKY